MQQKVNHIVGKNNCKCMGAIIIRCKTEIPTDKMQKFHAQKSSIRTYFIKTFNVST